MPSGILVPLDKKSQLVAKKRDLLLNQNQALY